MGREKEKGGEGIEAKQDGMVGYWSTFVEQINIWYLSVISQPFSKHARPSDT
jgi:hypothetical protein